MKNMSLHKHFTLENHTMTYLNSLRPYVEIFMENFYFDRQQWQTKSLYCFSEESEGCWGQIVVLGPTVHDLNLRISNKA